MPDAKFDDPLDEDGKEERKDLQLDYNKDDLQKRKRLETENIREKNEG